MRNLQLSNAREILGSAENRMLQDTEGTLGLIILAVHAVISALEEEVGVQDDKTTLEEQKAVLQQQHDEKAALAQQAQAEGLVDPEEENGHGELITQPIPGFFLQSDVVAIINLLMTKLGYMRMTGYDEAVKEAIAAYQQEPVKKREMPNPTKKQLNSRRFAALWNTIKSWDISAPEFYWGYCGANGSHVALLLEALNKAEKKAKRERRKKR